VNQNSKIWQFNLGGLTNWLIILGIIWLLGSIGLGWIIKSFLVLVGLLIILPIVAVIIFSWWFNKNIVVDQCPVCQHEFTALNKTQCQCPNCGEILQVTQGKFSRLTPEGTIDVTAVEVESTAMLDEGN